MATKTPKKPAAKAKTSTKAKTSSAKTATQKAAVRKSVKAKKAVGKKQEKIVNRKAITTPKKDSGARKFFAKKYSQPEDILTIFKDKKFYGALIGELIGTMLISILLLSVGYNLNLIIIFLFVFLGVVMAIHKLSGAHFNPLITVGMMATRRISLIRGIMYMVVQLLGAWFAMLILGAFINKGAAAMSGGIELMKMAEIKDEMFWATAIIELIGATVVGFFFARAWQYRKKSFTFAAVVAGGLITAVMAALLFSSYAGLSENFILNPAVAIMYKIFPTEGNFGELLQGIVVALVTYIIFPMIGGVLGFFLSDFSSVLSEEEIKE